MNASKNSSTANIIPTMKYNDAVAAIEWLVKAFGFKKHLVVEGAPGKIAHAQLTYGPGMIMLGSAGDSEFDTLQKPPSENSNATTQSAYIVVDDADAHYKQAVANGAKIVMELADADHGGRFYACKDPEGHLWNFGTYDPWQ